MDNKQYLDNILEAIFSSSKESLKKKIEKKKIFIAKGMADYKYELKTNKEICAKNKNPQECLRKRNEKTHKYFTNDLAKDKQQLKALMAKLKNAK